MRLTPRRLLATLVVGLGSAAALVAGPTGAAHAAPATCEYPVAACEGPALSLSTSVAAPTEVVDVAGTGFLADKRVTLQLQPVRSTSGAQPFAPRRSYVLRSVRTGSDGSFTIKVTAPKTASGKYDVLAVNGTPRGFNDPTAPLTVRADGDGNRDPNSNDETTTAFTGVNLLWLLLLAAALIAVGAYAARRGGKNPVRSIHG